MAEQTRQIIVEPSGDRATGRASEFVQQVICESVEHHGQCFLALAGGTTPHGLYLHLAADGLSGAVPWQNVVVFFGDERDVPHDHVESNFRMAQRTLLDHVPVPPSNVHPMPADAEDLAGAAAAYEQTVRRAVPGGEDGLPRLDLILLGMGIDGHTASLFPGTEALQERQKLVTAYFVPVLGRSRMTFTYPMINATRHVVLLVTGADKAPAVARLLGDDSAAKAALPVAGVMPTDGRLIVVLDAEAARQANLS